MRSKKMKSNTIPVILFVIKLALGVIFVYSSFHKIEDPAAFAKIIYGYGVFPDLSVNLIAICVPFIELTTGFCLIFGVYPRSCVIIVNLMLVFFIALISFNLARGHQFDCGCFTSVQMQNQTVQNIVSLVRDIFLLGAGLFYLRHTAATDQKS